jgi:hypothetical protein
MDVQVSFTFAMGFVFDSYRRSSFWCGRVRLGIGMLMFVASRSLFFCSHLTHCFNHSIEVKIKLTRYKHWFQYPGYYRYPHDTLVIAQFRNPYDWLKAMQHVPHHSPNHLKYRSDSRWKEFLMAPWTMERVGTDRWDNWTEPCQEHFQYKDLVSCMVEPLPRSHYGHTLHYSEHQPFYEMRYDGSGKPYKNIMELRSDKIRNFLTIKDYQGIADVWAVQYEYLLTKGTAQLVSQIEEWTGVKANCTPMPPQQRTSRPVEKDMANYIRAHLNWTVEGWIGYGPHETKEEEKKSKK